ncbi:MAG TPA: ABC transporter substrate-binding protein [Candidatus Sulfotelmatobacter sp.]|nr:ABC transporter substrate-binding protein [Candidatus Sulfotelmatobacter sp.]
MKRRQLLTGFLVLVALVAIGALAGTAAHAQSAKPLKKVTFLTNYVFHGRHSPYFVGLDKGFYKEAGFDIQISPATGSGFVLSALEGGKADYGMAESTSVVQAIAKGGKAKGFSVFMDITTSGLASLTPYPTPESVVGKSIAASLTDSARVILPIIFSLKGLDPAGIKWQAADPGVYFPLILEGKVDLFTASIDGDVPALMKVAGPQGKTVHFSSFADWGYDVFGYFLVTNSEKLASSPDEVRAFAAATAKAVKYSIEHPEETAQIMVKYNPTLDPATTLAQWRQSIKAIDTAYVKQNGYGVATPARLQRTVDLVKQAFKLTGTMGPNDIYAQGFVSR